MKNALFVFAFLFSTMLLSQQYGGIKGAVTDKAMNSEPLLFANVQIKNFGTTTETNFHGNYEFNDIVPGEYTLVVSYLGYETTEVPIVVTADAVTRLSIGLSPLLPSFDELEVGDEVSNESKFDASSISVERLKE